MALLDGYWQPRDNWHYPQIGEESAVLGHAEKLLTRLFVLRNPPSERSEGSGLSPLVLGEIPETVSFIDVVPPRLLVNRGQYLQSQLC